MKQKVAAIFAHPDDEILGCGATLARHVIEGDDVAIFIMATGLTSRGEAVPEEFKTLQGNARAAAKELGVQNVTFGAFPDNAMDSVPLLNVVKAVEEFLKDFPATVVYTHHMGDMNIDHEVVARAVLTATRPLPDRGELTVLASEINSSTEYAAHPMPAFVPTEYVNVTNTVSHKIKAMACYTGELREWPHPRSLKGIEHQACNRGVQSGYSAAEAFMTLRRIRP